MNIYVPPSTIEFPPPLLLGKKVKPSDHFFDLFLFTETMEYVFLVPPMICQGVSVPIEIKVLS